ncbi:hydroxyethylthiazole kinase [Martelella lutilitoris]|uniref:Hydroxyethylthiazole kinase n=1 Tax=Martelella lutilitoris TaxID=2583532 RepID=A0A5C4JS91_9HYPH|nr:hydroxyethylthiazole kinase [Martelella lutilitoris]TNB48273.1 hydroxyethylthiazole kinase [Martelella lutilitoris]
MADADILLSEMREKAPLVHCITNHVAMNIAANVLLAAGASPAMVLAEEEAGEFAGLADALTINIGTLTSERLASMKAATAGARNSGKPWVFDPVAHFATGFRRQAARDILDLGPTVLRGNASEILAFSDAPASGKGVDAGDGVEAAEETARRLAAEGNMVVAVTGETDFVTDGRRAARVAGGSPLMPKVTALGCALTCLVGAFVGTRPADPFSATVAAFALYAVAGGKAHPMAQGPGSFAVQFLDALAATTPAELKAGARVTHL